MKKVVISCIPSRKYNNAHLHKLFSTKKKNAYQNLDSNLREAIRLAFDH